MDAKDNSSVYFFEPSDLPGAEEHRTKLALERADDHPEVAVTCHGGVAPEQCEGSVNGHTFYLRRGAG
ncbi:hypothetical protein BH24ACT5_BH24ACT5_24030 [soil metagenome]